MANPDYATLLALIAAETDPVVIAQLEAQCYVFNDVLTEAEKELFEYAAFDYIENNPGYVDGFVSPGLYVLPDYVVEGYINTVEAIADLYMVAGYVESGYVEEFGSGDSGYSSYVGIYFSDNGERT